MPKKGLRKIVVDGQTYNYIIKPMFRHGPHNKTVVVCRITIELAKDKYYSEDICDSDDPITPSMVEQIIRENL